MLRKHLRAPPWFSVRGLATQASGFTRTHQRYSLLEDDPAHTDPVARRNIPVFTISGTHGFLPRDDPLAVLPPVFAPLDSLLSRMTIAQPGGVKGLLAYGQLGHAVKQELKTAGLDAHVTRAIESGDQVNAVSGSISLFTRRPLNGGPGVDFGAVPRLLLPGECIPTGAGRPAFQGDWNVYDRKGYSPRRDRSVAQEPCRCPRSLPVSLRVVSRGCPSLDGVRRYME